MLGPNTSGTLSWSIGDEPAGSIGYTMHSELILLRYRFRRHSGEWEDVEQNIFFDQTPCNYGGYRKWFLCPRCMKRVAILYGSGKYFFCRHCHQLTYDSCNSPPLQRIFDRANKLKEKLGGHAGFDNPIPARPKGMHRRTYNRLRLEIYRLEDQGERGMAAKWGICF